MSASLSLAQWWPFPAAMAKAKPTMEKMIRNGIWLHDQYSLNAVFFHRVAIIAENQIEPAIITLQTLDRTFIPSFCALFAGVICD
jgi:hypothetical protein